MRDSKTSSVLVTGATGFIGKDLVSHLLECEWRVKAMSRNGPGSLPLSERLEFVQADMRDELSLRRAVSGVSVVVHLAAAKSDEADSQDINVHGAERLARLCLAEGCLRLINVSTQSVGIARKGAYARTKSAAEKIFRDSELHVTTLRPSLVYGEEKSGVFGVVLNFVRRLPAVPVLGDGQWISAPVYVGDVSRSIIGCIENDCTIGKTYSIGGPRLVTFDELIDRIGAAIGVQRRKIHFPFALSLWATQIITTLWAECPITVSNVLGSNQNVDIDIGSARRDFGFDPLPLERGLALVLGTRGDLVDEPDRRAAEEFSFISRYLMDVDPPPELVNRYVAATRKLLGDAAASEWEFVRRHPRLLPYLDAAAGVFSPRSLLRNKILLAAAILEASPAYAEFFLEEREGRFRVLRVLIWQGLRSAVKLAVGVPLLQLARRT